MLARHFFAQLNSKSVLCYQTLLVRSELCCSSRCMYMYVENYFKKHIVYCMSEKGGLPEKNDIKHHCCTILLLAMPSKLINDKLHLLQQVYNN